MIKKILLVNLLMLFMLGCSQNETQPNNEQTCKQELSKSTDWVSSWRTCSGDGAFKKDGTLWQFGKTGGCDWGQKRFMNSKNKLIWLASIFTT